MTIFSNNENLNDQKFLTACRTGELAEVKALLTLTNMQSAVSINYNTALELACYNSRMNIVQHLLTIKIIRDAVTSNNNVALVHASVLGGNLEVIKYLLTFDKIKETIAINGNAALITACNLGRLEIVQYLLSFDKVKDAIAINNNAVLMAASNGVHLPIVKILCKYPDVRANFAVNNFKLMEEIYIRRVSSYKVLEYLLRLVEFRMVLLKEHFNSAIINYLKIFLKKALEDPLSNISLINQLLSLDHLNQFYAKKNNAHSIAAYCSFSKLTFLQKQAFEDLLDNPNFGELASSFYNSSLLLACHNLNLEAANILLQQESVRAKINNFYILFYEDNKKPNYNEYLTLSNKSKKCLMIMLNSRNLMSSYKLDDFQNLSIMQETQSHFYNLNKSIRYYTKGQTYNNKDQTIRSSIPDEVFDEHVLSFFPFIKNIVKLLRDSKSNIENKRNLIKKNNLKKIVEEPINCKPCTKPISKRKINFEPSITKKYKLI